MAKVVIRQGGRCIRMEAEAGTRVSDVLAAGGVEASAPCGGRGVCGKCAVMLAGQVSAPSGQEQRAGVRLACQARIEGDAEIILPQAQQMVQIATGADAVPSVGQAMPGQVGAAVDVGTTTLVLRLFDLREGRSLGVAAMANPQGSVSADVIGRMEAALAGQGELLRDQVTDAIQTLLVHACAQGNIAPDTVESAVVTGNTAMMYLLWGVDPRSLTRAPFQAEHLFGDWHAVGKRQVYVPRCLHALIGADTTCAVLASGMLHRDETALLCDMGTNGEMALWKDGTLYVTSTAVGPAFEGAGISCGCASVPGAIDRVDVMNGRLYPHTIGGGAPVGLCGSGLISVLAVMLDLGVMDETGLLEGGEIQLSRGVTLRQADVRAAQLAKAAVAAGMDCLLSAAGCAPGEVQHCYLAGGFGSGLSLPHAVRIGLIPPEVAGKVHVIGNATLNGAAMLLMDQGKIAITERIAAAAKPVQLGGQSDFEEKYIRHMALQPMHI